MNALSPKTAVLQSHRSEALQGWRGRCCASVEGWADRQGFAYRMEGDECLERVPATLRERFADQVVVLTDLARLLWQREVLGEGFDRAIWVDADVLFFRDFDPPATGDHVGREIWIQPEGRRLRSFRKVHNAWLQFSHDSVFLPFYLERATKLLERVTPPVVPQFVGPKLLTAWHNTVAFDVEERVGMCSPQAMQELLAVADGRLPHPKEDGAVRRLVRGHGAALCALNLCSSYEDRPVDGVCHRSRDYDSLVEALLSRRLDGLFGSA